MFTRCLEHFLVVLVLPKNIFTFCFHTSSGFIFTFERFKLLVSYMTYDMNSILPICKRAYTLDAGVTATAAVML